MENFKPIKKLFYLNKKDYSLTQCVTNRNLFYMVVESKNKRIINYLERYFKKTYLIAKLSLFEVIPISTTKFLILVKSDSERFNLTGAYNEL